MAPVHVGTRLHMSPLPGTDSPQAARSNISPNILLGTVCTDFVYGLVRLKAEAASDDLFLDLGGAAETRLDAAAPPELTIVAESIGLALLPVQADSIESARAAASAWCIFVPKPSSGANYQRCSTPGLGQTVRRRLPVSTAVGGDLLTGLPGHPGVGVVSDCLSTQRPPSANRYRTNPDPERVLHGRTPRM